MDGGINLFSYVENNPGNLVDPYGLHRRGYWHIHSSKNRTDYAESVPFITGPTIYYPPYDELLPVEQESVDYHEGLHRKYSLFMSEKRIWEMEIEFIQKQIDKLPCDDPNRPILEKWKKRNEKDWRDKYGTPSK